ncbi:MAG: hypothetical protein ACM3O3_11325 [Syntrophothermus sp.]
MQQSNEKSNNDSEAYLPYEKAFKTLRAKEKRNKKLIGAFFLILSISIFIFILSLISEL